MHPTDEEFIALLEGTLPTERAAAIRRALQNSEALRLRFARMESLTSLLQQLPGPALPTGAKSRMLNALERNAQTTGHGLPWRVWLSWCAVGATTAALLWYVTSTPERQTRTMLAELPTALADDYEVVADLDVLGLDDASDVDVVSQLHLLETIQ